MKMQSGEMGGLNDFLGFDYHKEDKRYYYIMKKPNHYVYEQPNIVHCSSNDA